MHIYDTSCDCVDCFQVMSIQNVLKAIIDLTKEVKAIFDEIEGVRGQNNLTTNYKPIF